MGVISDAASGLKDDADKLCPTCGGPVPAGKIAKEAGFPAPGAPGGGGKANIDATPVPRGADEKAPVTSSPILGRPG